MSQRSPRRIGPFRAGAGLREAMWRAHEEALARNHRQIRPVHLLLGVAMTADPRVDAVLDALGVPRSYLSERAAGVIGASLPPDEEGGEDLAYTQRAVRVVLRAALFAEELGWGWLGAVHLLVALGEEDWGGAPRALEECGVTAHALKQTTITTARQLAPEPSSEPPLYWWDTRADVDASSPGVTQTRPSE